MSHVVLKRIFAQGRGTRRIRRSSKGKRVPRVIAIEMFGFIVDGDPMHVPQLCSHNSVEATVSNVRCSNRRLEFKWGTAKARNGKDFSVSYISKSTARFLLISWNLIDLVAFSFESSRLRNFPIFKQTRVDRCTDRCSRGQRADTR